MVVNDDRYRYVDGWLLPPANTYVRTYVDPTCFQYQNLKIKRGFGWWNKNDDDDDTTGRHFSKYEQGSLEDLLYILKLNDQPP